MLDVLKGQAVSIASRRLSSAVRNLPGLSGSKGSGKLDSSDLSQLNVKSKHSVNAFQFPLDVLSGDAGIGNHGHYIMFEIMQIDSAELKFGNKDKPGQSGVANMVKEVSARNMPDQIKVVKTRLGGEDVQYENQNFGLAGAHSQLINQNTSKTHAWVSSGAANKDAVQTDAMLHGEVDSETRKTGQNVYIKRAPRTKLDTFIAMYMPPQVTVNYGANYTDTEIGAGAKLGMDAYSGMMAGKGFREVAGKVLDDIGGILSEGLTKAALGGASVLPGMAGLKEAYEIGSGVIIADRMELAFKGINKRKFSYTFKMIPKSKEESEEIQKIIHAFKFNMLPEMVGGNRAGRKMRHPNTFKISYMYLGAKNQYINDISECVLETMDVTYGGSRYKTFDADENGAPPVETSLTLNFQELELITRERVQEGF